MTGEPGGTICFSGGGVVAVETPVPPARRSSCSAPAGLRRPTGPRPSPRRQPAGMPSGPNLSYAASSARVNWRRCSGSPWPMPCSCCPVAWSRRAGRSRGRWTASSRWSRGPRSAGCWPRPRGGCGSSRRHEAWSSTTVTGWRPRPARRSRGCLGQGQDEILALANGRRTARDMAFALGQGSRRPPSAGPHVGAGLLVTASQRAVTLAEQEQAQAAGRPRSRSASGSSQPAAAPPRAAPSTGARATPMPARTCRPCCGYSGHVPAGIGSPQAVTKRLRGQRWQRTGFSLKCTRCVTE